MNSAVLAAMLILESGVPTGGAVPVAKNSTADTKTHENPDKMICHRDAAATGSIMARRVCHTKKEWVILENAAHDDIDQLRDLQRARSSSLN